MDALKGKAIQEYDKLLRELRKGKKPKYDDLMNLICYIELPVELDHISITLYFMNHDDTVYLRFGM